MIRKYRRPVLIILLIVSAGVYVYALRTDTTSIEQYNSVDRPAKIHPDYSGTVIPPNIAPLNFLIEKKADRYLVKIYSEQGPAIEVSSKKPKIIIPQNQWRRLLDSNKGQELYFDIFVKARNGRWNKFATITNRIAREDIDGFLVYRKMHPTHTHKGGKMAIYQRKLENFNESVVLDNGYYKGGCLNCHAFCGNRTDKMLIGIRSYSAYGVSTLLIENGVVNKIGAKFGYTSWHPSGKMAVYSINNLPRFYHFARNEVRDTVDLNSLLAYYLVDSKTVKTSLKISKKNRLETWPTWSADGRYLYFCSAPILWTDQNKTPPDRYNEVKYDLMRISYDIETDKWGELETILLAQDTGLSIAMPRISPDGHWLLFCMFNYGYFPPWQQSSDLYLIDLEAARQTGRVEYRKLEINSSQSESWHSWSSNSRWIVFSSKRDYGVFTRSYISYVDQTGKVQKPILLPQKDPEFYDSCLKIYNIPELVTQPVQATGGKLGRVIRNSAEIAVNLPITMATPAAGKDPWQLRE